MQIASTTKDGVCIVAPGGVIDTRTSQAFEAAMVQAFASGTRSFAVDFGKVTLITSAGIRVLVMMTHRLQRVSGGLALFGLTDRVKAVFEIGGLLQQFAIVGTEAQALELLSKPKDAPARVPVRPSRLSALLFDVVCADDALHRGVTPPAPDAGRTLSAVTDAVVAALERWSPPEPTGSASE